MEGQHWLTLLEERAAREHSLVAQLEKAQRQASEAEQRAKDMERRAQLAEERQITAFKNSEALRQGLKRMREAADSHYRVAAAGTARMFADRNLLRKEERHDIVQEELEKLETFRKLVVDSLEHLL